MVKNILVAAPVLTRSGYGAHARELVRALIRSNKYDVKIIPTRWGATPQTAINPSNPDDADILSRIVDGVVKQKPDVFIQVTIPNEFQPVGVYNIGITAGIETSQCAPGWIEGVNKMDLVITTSEHSKMSFINSRYDVNIKETGERRNVEVLKPIKTLFEGIDTSMFNIRSYGNDSELTKYMNTQIEEDFCFLYVGHWLDGSPGNDRKDVSTLVRTFLDAFHKKAKQNRPAIILKTSGATFSAVDRHVIDKKINDIKNSLYRSGATGELPSIYVIHGDLSDAQMNELYNHSKVKAMVTFTHGEGFGKPLLEFSATGKPVIAPNWSGHIDFLHPEYTVLLDGQLKPVSSEAVNDWIIAESSWFYVNRASAQVKLADVFAKYDEYHKLSRKQRKHVMDNFTFDQMAERLVAYIDDIENISKEAVSSGAPMKITIPKVSGDKPKFTLPKLKVVPK